MLKMKSFKGLKKEELYGCLLDSIEERFGSSYTNRGGHLFYGHDGCYTDEDVEKSRQEFLRNGGVPDAPSFIINFVSVPNPPPWESVTIDSKQQPLDKPGFDDFLD